MVEVKLNYTPEEYSMLLDALNHSLILLRKTYTSAKIGCELPSEFYQKFDKMTLEEIEEYTTPRLQLMYDFYKQMVSLENERDAGVV